MQIDELLNAPILFGLKAQGHIPKIQEMLEAGKNWKEIGEAIGWCPVTARGHYESYMQKQANAVNPEVFIALAEMVELVKKFAPKDGYSADQANRQMYWAEKCLLSTPKK